MMASAIIPLPMKVMVLLSRVGRRSRFIVSVLPIGIRGGDDARGPAFRTIIEGRIGFCNRAGGVSALQALDGVTRRAAHTLGTERFATRYRRPIDGVSECDMLWACLGESITS